MKTKYHISKICLAIFFFIAIAQVSFAQNKKVDVVKTEAKSDVVITEPIKSAVSDEVVQKKDPQVVNENGIPCIKAYKPETEIKKPEDTVISGEPK